MEAPIVRRNNLLSGIGPRFHVVWPGVCQVLALLVATSLITACATTADITQAASSKMSGEARISQVRLLDRITWGASDSAVEQLRQSGTARFLERQLHPARAAPLPPAVQAQIDAMTITQRPLAEIVLALEQQRKSADAIADDAQKKIAQQAYQQELNRLGREAATRTVLRALYSQNQLQELMTWFWFNHFNVHQYKSNVRALVGDYEENAIRPQALGRFRDLLGATVHHAAMLRYLDNEQNAVGHLNENYARELLELHTLGVDGGYTQHDVQELARILTGVGVNVTGNKPAVRPQLAGHYVHEGLFEFNPNRHDYGDKTLLSQRIRGSGMAEVDEALDLLARQPATARFISKRLALYFVSDNPPPELVRRMAQTYLSSDGDIGAILNTMLGSNEFRDSLETKFKDPMHYVLSAVRLAYDNKPILNAGPILSWLGRLGESPYAHETPDGYPLTQSAWASPGQMNTRIEIAKAIGGGNAGMFKTAGPPPAERSAFPQLANALYYQSIQYMLRETTRQTLAEANSPQEWSTYLLASPEFMFR